MSCTQTKPVRPVSKMDSNSKHCPSRSSVNLAKQSGCSDDQKDSAGLSGSCSTTSAADDRKTPTGNEPGTTTRPCGMEEMAAAKADGSMVSVNVAEDCVTASQTVSAPSGGSPPRVSELSTTSPPPGGDSSANERLSATGGTPAVSVVSSAGNGEKEDGSVATIAAQAQNEASPQGTKR